MLFEQSEKSFHTFSLCPLPFALCPLPFLSKLSSVKLKEILFRHSAAIVGAILFGEDVAEAADFTCVIRAAGNVKSARAAKRIVFDSLLGQDRRMVDLNSLDAHFDQIFYVLLLAVRMRDDGYAARAENDLDALLNFGREISDRGFKLGLALLRNGESIFDELRMLIVRVNALLFKNGEDLRIIVKIVAGECIKYFLPGHSGAKASVSKRLFKKQMASFSVARSTTVDQLAHRGVFGVKIIAEKVKSRTEPLCNKLDAEHRIDSRLSASNLKAVRALDGIVVCQDKCFMSKLRADLNELFGREKAIRNIRMQMAIGKKVHFAPPWFSFNHIITQNRAFCKFLYKSVRAQNDKCRIRGIKENASRAFYPTNLLPPRHKNIDDQAYRREKSDVRDQIRPDPKRLYDSR